MFCGTDNILQNLFHVQFEWGDILWNIVNHTKHSYFLNNVMFFLCFFVSFILIREFLHEWMFAGECGNYIDYPN